MKIDAMHDMIIRRNMGIKSGIPSYCTSNDLVLEAILQQGKRFRDEILIEGTANQINQFGGYTGMHPADFRDKVYEIADRVGFPRGKIILGGDHLGPLTWADENEESAMQKAEDLVREFVLAGYKKIHLDTSMRVADDPRDEILSTRTIARRGARLYKVCEEAYQQLLKDNPEEMRPSYIIGSEVPIPGGEQSADASVQVTSPEALRETIDIYKEEFNQLGLGDLFHTIVGIVTQPGVEFGDEKIVHYDRVKAAALRDAIAEYPDMVLEGHSTDYQSPDALREMVEDGVGILKVGPALTFALREGLFALSCMEAELVPEEKRANLPAIWDQVMLDDPKNWGKYYQGTDEEKALKRKYSLSDRSRYYYNAPAVQEAIAKLFANLDEVHIPLGMVRQYMPQQFLKICKGTLPCKARELAKDKVVEITEDYNYATKYNYITASALVK